MKRLYGLVGYPLGHSFSRAFFQEKFEREGIDASYENFEMASLDGLRQLIAEREELCGLNVTIPYKTEVIALLDELDDQAREIGAVNVIQITRHPGGQVWLKGYNSDIIGFTRSIAPLIGDDMRQALILGTGGASKAVYAGLKSLHIDATFVSRKRRGNIIAYDDLTPELMASHRIVVNTTPLGMYPHTDECPHIPYEALTPGHLCYDLIYNPEVTRFLDLSARQGCTTKNGTEMLHLQALAAWDIWNESHTSLPTL